MVLIFWDFLMFHQIFLEQQIKSSLIIRNKHGIFDLPNKQPRHKSNFEKK